MRTIVQLSDLHFGTILEPTIEPILATVNGLKPDLVVISGDLTQRARRVQYREAKEFMGRLPTPQIVIPGNHDVPAYNLYRRFAQSLERYKHMITENLAPQYIDEEIAVFGINTARALVIKGGKVSQRQLDGLEEQLNGLTHDPVKVVVAHHPFDLPRGLTGVEIVGRAQAAMEVFARHRIDLFLGGHLHLAFTGSTSRYNIPDYDAPIVQAGTATSTRARGEPNSFSVIRIDSPHISVDTYTWYSERRVFEVSVTHEFTRQPQR